MEYPIKHLLRAVEIAKQGALRDASPNHIASRIAVQDDDLPCFGERVWLNRNDIFWRQCFGQAQINPDSGGDGHDRHQVKNHPPACK